MLENRKGVKGIPAAEGGLTHDRKICWDGRVVDVASARRWMVQQLAKEVVKRLREQDNDEHKS